MLDDLELARARDCDVETRRDAATIVRRQWPERGGDARAFERPESDDESMSGNRRRVALALRRRRDGRCVGCALVVDSCEVLGCEGMTNATLNSLVVRETLRGRGAGARLCREARAWTHGTFGADVVTVWCEKELVGFYERCGFELERARGRDWGEACLRSFASDDAARGWRERNATLKL